MIGELVIKFHENGYIELDDTKAKSVSIGQLYRAGKMLVGLGDLIIPIDKIAIDNEETG
jgi:hypothetical protein